MPHSDILVALSGGLDSAAVVLLLRRQGYNPAGLYIDMLGSSSERERAETTAARLGIDLTIEDVHAEFQQQIVQHLLSQHDLGVTPAPCSRCNPLIKWSVLARVADRLGIEHIATGHYVKVVRHGARCHFARGVDPSKDQSYYLWGVNETLRRRAVTPLGDYTKAEVRAMLAEWGYSEISARRESMGVCFLGGVGYGDFLRRNLQLTPGEVCDIDGNAVGEHQGYQLYTIGQRRGFDTAVAGSVIGVEPALNRVIVGSDQQLLSSTLWLHDWIFEPNEPIGPTEAAEIASSEDNVTVMVRGVGRNPKGTARVEVDGDSLVVRLLHDTAWAAAAGQPVALYVGECVVGGGILARAE